MRRLILQLLRCQTLDDCRRIQAGNVFLRRLGKYSVLFSIAITIFVNDLIARAIDNVTGQYESARSAYNAEVASLNESIAAVNAQTSSVLYRWTVGWFFSPPSIPSAPTVPELDTRVITVYNVLNITQFAVFFVLVVWCLRWIYADCQVTGASFAGLMKTAAISNAILYVALRLFVLPILV